MDEIEISLDHEHHRSKPKFQLDIAEISKRKLSPLYTTFEFGGMCGTSVGSASQI